MDQSAAAVSARVIGRPAELGAPIAYWQLGALAESRYDVPDSPMAGEMDPFFFLTKHKNFIPHEYPCRTQFAREHRGKRPAVSGAFEPSRWWLPFGSPRVDLSGFWFRPTRIACWARTVLETDRAGMARVQLGTCGGAVLFLNGAEIGWMAPYSRNLEAKAEFELPVVEGRNELRIFFDDLAERDARFFFQLDYLSGPAARIAVPVPIAGDVADVLETILDGMRFERTHYLGGDVRVLFPRPLPVELAAHVAVEGEFISFDQAEFHLTLPAGATALDLGPAEHLPADFRHFKISLENGGFLASRSLGVEICHAERQGDAPALLADRIKEALTEVSERGEHDTVTAFARLASGRGGAETDAMIAQMLPAIEDCFDCADFVLVPLIWARTRWGDEIEPELRERIDRAILGYRYWMDEPGNDVQWYFSENHALLFHTAAYLAGRLFSGQTFMRSGRAGHEQSAVGRERVRAWLDHFERWEMAEFNSAPYFPIDLKGLTALMALAPDPDIADRARRAIARLLEIVARSSHHGMLTAAQGRSYEHTLRAGRSLELSGIARLLWGRGWYGRRVHALPQLAVCVRDHGLELPADLPAIADHRGEDGLEWRFAQGENRFAALYHYKTRDFALGSAARYRWNEWGYQETVLHLRLGERPEAAIWINHPGETIQFGYGRPSYWGGSGTLARVHQYRGLAVLVFAVHLEQPDFTHCWFPRDQFDETRVEASRAVARSGRGVVALRASAAFSSVDRGPTAGAELRVPGRATHWIVRATSGDDLGGAERFKDLALQTTDDTLIIDDPEYGVVHFYSNGTVAAEGRRLVASDWTIAGETTRLET